MDDPVIELAAYFRARIPVPDDELIRLTSAARAGGHSWAGIAAACGVTTVRDTDGIVSLPSGRIPHTGAGLLYRATQGAVERVTADAGRGDVTHLVLHHEGGATSTATVTLGAPEAADGFDLQVWGERGRSSVPPLADDPSVALRVALGELVANASSARTSHPCDVRFGNAVTRVLDQAQRAIDAHRG